MKLTIDVVFDTLSIPEIGFVGACASSPSGNWIVGWGDAPAHKIGSLPAPDAARSGLFVLVDGVSKELHSMGYLRRPSAGHVANSGYFCIEDWGEGGGTEGTFYAFLPSGQPLISRSFRANLYNSGISPSGRYAVCQTCNAPSADGDLLTAFRTIDGSELFSIHPATGWAVDYVFTEEPTRIGVVCRDVGTFYYDAHGCLVDPGGLSDARLASANASVAVGEAQYLLSAEGVDSTSLAERILAVCERLLAAKPTSQPTTAAQTYAVQGRAFELLGRPADAVAAYERALLSNPKATVKRRLKAVQKQLLAGSATTSRSRAGSNPHEENR